MISHKRPHSESEIAPNTRTRYALPQQPEPEELEDVLEKDMHANAPQINLETEEIISLMSEMDIFEGAGMDLDRPPSPLSELGEGEGETDSTPATPSVHRSLTDH